MSIFFFSSQGLDRVFCSPQMFILNLQIPLEVIIQVENHYFPQAEASYYVWVGKWSIAWTH